MTKSTAPQVVRSYLTRLRRALADLPGDVRDEITAGIREELEGLDAAAAAARIEALGDPEFIAAEARSEAGATLAAAVPAEPRWFPVLAALLVAFGGIVIPFVGWIVGIAMVWMSNSWRRADKWVATLTPFAAVAAVTLIVIVTDSLESSGVRSTPSTEDFGNPLIPTMYDVVWNGVVLALLVNVIVGIWLLTRARKGWQREQTATPAVPLISNQPTWYSVLTVALITVGGYVVPAVGWLVGVAMLWASDRWSRRDKWLGTLVGPAAIALGLLVTVGVTLLVRSGSTGNLTWWHVTLLCGLVLPLIANLIVGIRLLRR